MNISKVPNFKALQKLVIKPKEKDIIYCIEEQKTYIYRDNEWQEYVSLEPKDKGFQLELYELNRSIVSQLDNIEQPKEKVDLINKFYKETKNSFYMLYGREISYFTVFATTMAGTESLGKVTIECLSNIGEIKAIDLTEEKDAIECWVKNDEITTCLYLFPYDIGIVEIGV